MSAEVNTWLQACQVGGVGSTATMNKWTGIGLLHLEYYFRFLIARK